MKSLPFSWQLRVSKRALRPRITISAYGKVELVWPTRMSQEGAVTMLINHQAWVVNQLEKIDDSAKSILVLPQQIQLYAVGVVWQINYVQRNRVSVKISEEEAQLHVYADLKKPEAIRKALCVWLKGKGKLYLSLWLADAGSRMGLSYNSLSIRLQKKRWGSCSAAKNINLNAALLFLPKDLVEHVLIHELAHLKYLNHSVNFWSVVKEFDSLYAEKRKQLRKQSVPSWVTESFV